MRSFRIPRSAVATVAAGATLLLCGSAAAQAPPENKALNQAATASSVEPAERGGSCRRARNGCGSGNATDGDTSTRWGSDWAESQWLQVDLGRPRALNLVQVSWHLAFPRLYRISTSTDGVTFTDIQQTQSAFRLNFDEYVQSTGFAPQVARYVRVTSVERFWPQRGISIWELRVAGPADPVTPPSTPPPPAPPPEPAPAPPAAAAPPATTVPAAPFETTSSSAAPPPRSRRQPLSPFPTVRIKGVATRTGARIDLLQVRYARGASVRVVCRGGGCSQRLVRRVGSGRVPSIRGFFKAGATIEVFVTRPGHLGKYSRFFVRSGARAPRRTDSCVIHGGSRPTSCSR